MERVIQTEGAYVSKVLLQDSLSGIEMDQWVMHRHREVAGCFMFFQFYRKLGSEKLFQL